jgi:hypothetical protein
MAAPDFSISQLRTGAAKKKARTFRPHLDEALVRFAFQALQRQQRIQFDIKCRLNNYVGFCVFHFMLLMGLS